MTLYSCHFLCRCPWTCPSPFLWIFPFSETQLLLPLRKVAHLGGRFAILVGMNQPLKQRSALGPMVALLGMGIFGTILFALLLVLLSPLILFMTVYLGIQRWKFRKAFAQAQQQADQQANFSGRPSKHVEVTVHPVDDTP